MLNPEYDDRAFIPKKACIQDDEHRMHATPIPTDREFHAMRMHPNIQLSYTVDRAKAQTEARLIVNEAPGVEDRKLPRPPKKNLRNLEEQAINYRIGTKDPGQVIADEAINTQVKWVMVGAFIGIFAFIFISPSLF
jgi:hypothetical protein